MIKGRKIQLPVKFHISDDGCIYEHYWVYILHCNDDTYYVGMCKRWKKRYIEHKYIDSRAAKYVRKRRPFKLMCLIPCYSHQDAAEVEVFVRNLPRDQKEILVGVWRNK